MWYVFLIVLFCSQNFLVISVCQTCEGEGHRIRERSKHRDGRVGKQQCKPKVQGSRQAGQKAKAYDIFIATKIFKDELPQNLKINENVIKSFSAKISAKDRRACIQIVFKHSPNHLNL